MSYINRLYGDLVSLSLSIELLQRSSEEGCSWSRWLHTEMNWVGSNSCCGVVISQISVLASAAFMWLRSELILTVLNPIEVKISSPYLTGSYWSSQYAAKIVFYITLSFFFWLTAFLIANAYINFLLFFSTWKAIHF